MVQLLNITIQLHYNNMITKEICIKLKVIKLICLSHQNIICMLEIEMDIISKQNKQKHYMVNDVHI